MADCYRRPRHTVNYPGWIQNTIRDAPTSLDDPIPAVPSLPRSSGQPGQRSVRFAEKGGDRIREWTRLYKFNVHYHQVDRGPSASSQLTATEPFPADPSLQNGNNSACLSFNKPKRSFDIYRPHRRISTCPDPSVVTTLPSVSMARQTVPVQGAPIRSITGTARVHEGPQAPSSLGQTEGHQDIGVPGRFDHHSCHQGTVSQGYRDGSTQTEEPGLLDQGSQVQLDTLANPATPGIRNRHEVHDAKDSRQESPRRTARGIQVGTQGDLHNSTALVVHRQGHCHDSCSLPSAPQGPALAGGQDPSLEIGLILGGLDLSSTDSNRGTSLVAHSPSAMERALMDCEQPSGGRLHRRIGHGLGHCDQQSILQRFMVTTTTIPTHQLQRTADSHVRLTATGDQGAHSECDLGQHHHDRIYQSLRRDSM